ncbi:hypothetical protein TYRP_018650 [Tyrophagus putrescentiae]|nr:hypothetical protein TYRP_018650 [Tyrophagus putrescentiae]
MELLFLLELRTQNDARKEHPANVKVLLEGAGTLLHIVDVRLSDDPVEVGATGGHRQVVRPALVSVHAGQRQRGGHQRGEAVQPQLDVVLLVLVGVQCVVDERPADAAQVERKDGGVVQRAVAGGRPAEQCSPVEGHAEDQLRPVGEALAGGVDDHQRHGAESEGDAAQVKLKDD